MKKIKPKQLRFVKEYCIDLNGTRAAIRAGYSKKSAETQAWNLLKMPYIRKAVAQEQAMIAKRIEISQDRVAQEMALVAFADMADFITIDEGGAIKAIPLDQLKPGMSRIIRKV
ncbi:MAG: terminase small subunit, partial [Smithella sp.]